MEIHYPDNFSIDDLQDTFLWRYVGIHQLFDLVLNRQIYFSRLDKFEDSLEGLTSNGIKLKLFTLSKPLTYENINPNIVPERQKIYIEESKANRQAFNVEFTSSQQTQFASCWFLGKKESLSMWKIYSDKNGVALKFNAKELTETIIKVAESYTHTDFQQLTFGPLSYKNIWPFDPTETFDGKFSAMKKDNSYSHENEFRFLTVVPLEKKAVYENFKLPIGVISNYDMEIVTNPFMRHWEIENLKGLLKPYGIDTKLINSGMAINSV